MDGAYSEIVDRMIDYLKLVLETSNPVFSGMPICPFSRQARLANKIFYYVYPFSSIDLKVDSVLIHEIKRFASQSNYDLMLVIHPDLHTLTLQETHNFVQALNQQLATFNILAFDGHPEDDFNIQGVFTRKAPYIHLTIQMMQKVKEASDQLLKTAYYDNWQPEHLQYVGMPRG